MKNPSFFPLIIGFLFFTTWSSLSPVAVAQVKEANDPKAHELIRASRHWMESNKSLKATFSYTRSQSGRVQDQGQGFLLISGKAYQMQIAGQILYCNGQILYVYQPEIQEVSIQQYEAEEDEINPLRWLSTYEKNYRAKYIRSQTAEGLLQDIIDLIPSARSSVQKIRLYLEHTSHRPSRFEIYDKNDQVYSYLIKSFQLNPPVKTSDFIFDTKAHPKVMINDMR